MATRLLTDEDVAELLSAALGWEVRPEHIATRVQLTQGTFPKELVRLEVEDHPSQDLFVKYENGVNHDDAGARGGVTYEAHVYRHLLPHLDVSTVRFHGHLNFGERSTIMVIEGLPDSLRLNKVPAGRGLVAAGRWLGEFHRQTSRFAVQDDYKWVNRYSRSLLEGWCGARRGGAWPSRYQHVLAFLCEEAIPELLSGTACIIHGEFFPKNILFQEGAVYPVDWESTAVGPAEIDLAMLIDGWPPDTREAVHKAYATARWQAPLAQQIRRRLDLAEMLLHVRWLRSAELQTNAVDGSSRRLTQLLELHERVA